MRGKLLDTITLHKEHEVSFDVYCTYFSSFQQGPRNIIVFTTKTGYTGAGSNIPGVYAFGPRRGVKTTYGLIQTGDYVNVNVTTWNGRHGWRLYGNIPHTSAHKWISYKLLQTRQKDGRYLYQIFVDGKTVVSVINTNPREFKNVKVYVGGPSWFWTGRHRKNPVPAQPGYIRNLYYGSKFKDHFKNSHTSCN